VEFASKQAMLEQIERDKLNAFNVRLRDARKLYDRELISDDEYAKKKADILEEFVALSAPMEERLKLLKRLHEEKLILDDEYQRAREAILEGL
jgi:hypothetical protein